MKSPSVRFLTVALLLGLLILGALATTYSENWNTILGDSFDDSEIVGGVIDSPVGLFLIDDPLGMISRQTSGPDGFIRFLSLDARISDESALIGYPEIPFVEDHLLFDFKLLPYQTDCVLKATLNDDDDIPIFTVSAGDNGDWWVNGVDTQVSYEAGVEYEVTCFVDVDGQGGPAAFAVFVTEIDGSQQPCIMIASGDLPLFLYGDEIDTMSVVMPAGPNPGTFDVDEIYLKIEDLGASTSGPDPDANAKNP